jgi:hypothetical protein
MLNLHQLADQIAAMDDAYVFERWFRKASRNFHLWADPPTRGAILAAESVLSEYYLNSFGDSALKQELDNATRPFVAIMGAC